MEKMGFGNGRVPNNGKNGIREWNGPEQWKICKSGMERSRTMENREWNGPEQWKIWKSGMERSPTIENREWNDPEQ